MAVDTHIRSNARQVPRGVSGMGQWLLLALAAYAAMAAFHAFFGYYFWGQHGFEVGNDDAFISFRYARNIVDAGVASFNVTDPIPVEGYSNPLHVALSAVVYALVGPDLLYPVMAVAGGLAVALAIALVGQGVARRGGDTGLAGLVMLAAALCPPLWLHGTSGLETPFVFLGQAVFWLACARIGAGDGAGAGRQAAGAALIGSAIALVLLRTDGFLFPAIGVLWLAAIGRWVAAVQLLAATALAFGLQVGLRLWYYGLPLPLPTYVKVSGPLDQRLVNALADLASMAVKNGLLLPLAGFAIAGLVWLARLARTRRGALAALPVEVWLAGGLLSYFLLIGGDIYRDRFLIILYPMGTFLLLDWAGRSLGRRVQLAAAVLVIAWQVGAAAAMDRRMDYVFDWPKYDRWVVLGRLLGERHPGAVLAVDAAGKLPYFSGLHTIDMLGLNDRHIAFVEPKMALPGHNKFDPDYVFASRPDLICAHAIEAGSLAYWINRPRYLEEGYELAYLVHHSRVAEPVVETEGLSVPEIDALVLGGYSYGCVLLRRR